MLLRGGTTEYDTLSNLAHVAEILNVFAPGRLEWQLLLHLSF